MDYCLSKNASQKITNHESDEHELLFQIIDIQNMDDETCRVVLWDGENKKRATVTKQIQKKIKDGLITKWSIIKFPYFHVVDIESSLNENCAIKKNEVFVLEKINIEHNECKIEKKISSKYILNTESGRDDEQCEIENSSYEDIFSFSNKSEKDLKEEKNYVKLSDKYKHENKQQQITYEINDSDEEMRCTDSDNKKILNTIMSNNCKDKLMEQLLINDPGKEKQLENVCKELKEKDEKKIIEINGEMIKENSGEKMEENDSEEMDIIDQWMMEVLIPENNDNTISKMNDKEITKVIKNDNEDVKNKEVITVSNEQIDINDINLTKLSELTVTLQSLKITVKIHSIFSITRTNFFFIVQGNEKSPLMLCVAYPFIGNKLRNKIKPGTFLEVTNACVKYIDPQHSILCDDSTFELILNEFYKTRINILSVLSNNINDKAAKAILLQQKSNLQVESSRFFLKNDKPTVKPFAIPYGNNIKFTPFSTLKKKDDFKDKIINVIGRVVKYDECAIKQINNGERTVRHVTLVDMSNNELNLSLWDKQAVEYRSPAGSLLQILKARVTIFQGKIDLSVNFRSQIIICQEDN